MYRFAAVVKPFAAALLLLLVSLPVMAGEDYPSPHMMYFYNPSCRLCTKTNEVVGAAEEKFKDQMSYQRFNISDPEHGTDNVLYMFDLMDEMQVPEEDNTTLVVFLGILEKEGDEVLFTPKRVLVEGEEIIPKLESEITSFLAGEEKGVALGNIRPAGFFLAQRPRLADSF
ncbi:MAG: hypothetical protein LUC93_18055 [Planctomycetaceae bacterium]|nr:hypothetical protein [Planctomycetaceae bacterium]